jgi:hypothetical protein
VRACVRRRLEPRVDKEARQRLDGAVGGRGQQREPPASWVGCAARGGGAGEAGAAAAAWSRCRVSSWAGVLEVLDVLDAKGLGSSFVVVLVPTGTGLQLIKASSTACGVRRACAVPEPVPGETGAREKMERCSGCTDALLFWCSRGQRQ